MSKRPPPPVTDYLWDREGPADRRVVELEELLARYRRSLRPPFKSASPPEERAETEMGRVWYVAAAGFLLAVLVGGGLYYWEARRGREWSVTDARGSVRLVRGERLHTAAGRTLRISSPAIGEVAIAENTTLRLLEAREGRSTLELTAGTIHAKTTSPPGVFVVETPRARATDLGCEYTLRVDPGNRGRLHVDSGWVALSRGGRESLVPARSSAIFDEEGRLTPPWFDDAPPDFGTAVRQFSIAPSLTAVERGRALDRILAHARRRDSLTLLSLFPLPNVTREERLSIYDRLNELVPAPPGVTRERVASWTTTAADEWWAPVLKAAGIGPIEKGKKRRPPA